MTPAAAAANFGHCQLGAPLCNMRSLQAFAWSVFKVKEIGMRYQKLAVAIACVGLTVATASTSLYAKDKSTPPTVTSAHKWKHPEMHMALNSLRQAHLELQTAPHDFAGHRKISMQVTEEAIQQVETALKLDNDLPETPATRQSVPAAKVQDKVEGKKMLKTARRNLQTAETELKKSVHKFEGHRLKAIELTQEAIKQVDEGLAASK